MRTDENSTRGPPGAKRPRRAVVRAITLLALALVAAVGAAFMLTRYMDAKTAAARVPTVKVVVASAEIPVATALKEEWLAVVDWPTASLPEGTVSTKAELVNRVAVQPLAKNEPVLVSKLAEAGSRGGLASLLPDGMRAVAVRVDDVVGVAGFIHPGDHVDVIVTMKPDTSDSFASKVILQNVRVLAVGKDVEHKGRETEKAKPATVATLMVSPEDSEHLALAATRGKLLLALRGLGDSDVEETRGAVPRGLLADTRFEPPAVKITANRKPVAAKKPQNAAPTSTQPPAEKKVVEIMRGDLFERRDFAKSEGR